MLNPEEKDELKRLLLQARNNVQTDCFHEYESIAAESNFARLMDLLARWRSEQLNADYVRKGDV